MFNHPRPHSSCYILPTRIVDDATYGRTDVGTDRRTMPYHNTMAKGTGAGGGGGGNCQPKKLEFKDSDI